MSAPPFSTLQRPLMFYYGYDQEVWKIHSQYLMGSELLVAPCLDEGQSRTNVYFPADSGVWQSIVSFHNSFVPNLKWLLTTWIVEWCFDSEHDIDWFWNMELYTNAYRESGCIL